MVNDPSNIPARRRRATSQAKTGQNGSKHNDTQQVKQDSSELAQLQQLSLSSNDQSANKRHQSKPAPLFVIEHDNVVPPLRKQLSDDKASKRSKTPVNKQEATQKRASIDSDAPQQTAKADRQNRNQPTKTDLPETNSLSSQVKPTRSIARSPALVSMNNEPIPHKRRRREPTVDSANIIEMKGSNDKAKPTAKYAKKAPKQVAQSTGKADVKEATNTEAKKVATPARAKGPAKTPTDKPAQPSQMASDQLSAIKVTESKGPVPSKRRRRQPSTDNA